MSKPLFTAAELATHEQALAVLETKWRAGNFDKYWEQRKATHATHNLEETRRAQARPDEYLDALLILVGHRGGKYVEFDDAFTNSDNSEYRLAVQEVDTPENRRSLFTILKALTEVPRSWATSAFLRFLRGTGKQKDAKYHGAGTFGVRYGWKEEEVKAICQVLTGGGYDRHTPYSSVIMSYADVAEEIHEDDPDYEVVDYGTQFVATRATRDTAFLEKLCSILDSRGLGPTPAPADEKPKKDRKVKVFHTGDIIKKSNLRDLPLPAHVRIPIERQDAATKQWVDSTIEKIVTGLGNGRYSYAVIQPGKNSNTAYPDGSYSMGSKEDLFGATFLGEWKGKVSKDKTMRINFYYRRKQS